MRILHCCLACFYIDNYSYQENILPRYHKRMGNEVRIVASTETFDKNGEITYCKVGNYYNEDGIYVSRLPYVKSMPTKLVRKLRKYIGLKAVLEEYKPDYIFIHDIQFLDIRVMRDYAKRNQVKIVADCHADFSNSARSFLSRRILHGIVYKHCAKLIQPYVSKFYGVLPARVDFLQEVYGIPKEKTELLVMGAEDEKVISATSDNSIKRFRTHYGIREDDFLIVTGGKIDNFKRQILLLMDAVNGLSKSNVKLIVFGSIIPELEEDVMRRLSERVNYIGWLNSDDTYPHFAMADLVCFPGRHSVFWEEVVGIGIPLLVKYWAGTTHVDCGGNVLFLRQDSIEEMQRMIEKVMEQDTYNKMKKVALSCRNKFMYSEIAKKCLQ